MSEFYSCPFLSFLSFSKLIFETHSINGRVSWFPLCPALSVPFPSIRLCSIISIPKTHPIWVLFTSIELYRLEANIIVHWHCNIRYFTNFIYVSSLLKTMSYYKKKVWLFEYYVGFRSRTMWSIYLARGEQTMHCEISETSTHSSWLQLLHQYHDINQKGYCRAMNHINQKGYLHEGYEVMCMFVRCSMNLMNIIGNYLVYYQMNCQNPNLFFKWNTNLLPTLA